MRIEKITIYNLKIPFVRPVRHSLFSRTATESLVVVLHDRDGRCGFGEGTPREYVTGETLADSLSAAATLAADLLASPCETFAELTALLAAVGTPEVIAAHPAAFCALETAALDLWSRRADRPIYRLFMAGREAREVVYSGVIPAVDKAEEFAKYTALVKQLRLRFIKLKVSDPERGISQIQGLRNSLGPAIDIRIDANAAFSADTAIQFSRRAKKFGVSAMEQPVAKDDLAGMKRVSGSSEIPIIADESMYTARGPLYLIENRICHGLNIRLSSCGGFRRAREIYRLAQARKMLTMLGAHVGETAVLSLAGRHLAMLMPKVSYLEGSFSRYVLAEDLVDADVAFGPGGAAPVPTGPGLGIAVTAAAIEKWSQQYACLRVRTGNGRIVIMRSPSPAHIGDRPCRCG